MDIMEPYNTYPSDTASLYDEYIRNGIRYRKVATVLADTAGTLEQLTVVDLGCGTGILTQILAPRVGIAGQVIGIDASPDMLALAKQRTGQNINFICSSSEEIDHVIDEPVDAVFSSAAFWQFRREPTLQAIAKILRPGGKLYFNLSAGFFNLKASGMHQTGDELRPFKQSNILASWVEQARKRYPERDFSTKGNGKAPPQSLRELEKQLDQFGFKLVSAEPLRFEIPRDDEYRWLKIPQWTDRTLSTLTYEERLEILDEIFAGIPNDASSLGRWVTIVAELK